MSDKIRVGAVSYLNTKPFLFGLEQQPLRSNIQLSYQPPSIIAKDLLSGEIDLGLVPVAVIPQLAPSSA